MRVYKRDIGAGGQRSIAADEQYHVTIRNPSGSKRFYKAHETHYAPWVQQLVAGAPMHVEAAARVALPAADVELLSMPVGQAVSARHSGRVYAAEALGLKAFATLLRMAVGVRTPAAGGAGMIRRNVTNSGNLGSVEIYPVALAVERVPPGIYHYDSVAHDLALLHGGAFRTWLRECVFFQSEFAAASAALVLTSAFGRVKAKYGPRGYKLALFDVGHVSQNIYLLATSLGLEVCVTAGFIDERLDTALGLDGLDTAASLVLLVGCSPRGT